MWHCSSTQRWLSESGGRQATIVGIGDVPGSTADTVESEVTRKAVGWKEHAVVKVKGSGAEKTIMFAEGILGHVRTRRLEEIDLDLLSGSTSDVRFYVVNSSLEVSRSRTRFRVVC